MNKQLAKKGTTLNKNMANIESLSVTALNVGDRIIAHSAKIKKIGVEKLVAGCDALYLSTEIPDPYYL